MRASLDSKALCLSMLLALFASGCAGASAKRHHIRTAYDARAPIDSYVTWAWGEMEPTGDRRVDENTFLHENVRGAIEEDLLAKGFRQIESGAGADFEVVYRLTLDHHMSSTEMDQAFGVEQASQSSRWNYYGYTEGESVARSYTHSDTVGHLFLYILDGHEDAEEALVWRGQLEAKVHLYDESASRIRSLVGELLLRFPPPPEASEDDED